MPRSKRTEFYAVQLIAMPCSVTLTTVIQFHRLLPPHHYPRLSGKRQTYLLTVNTELGEAREASGKRRRPLASRRGTPEGNPLEGRPPDCAPCSRAAPYCAGLSLNAFRFALSCWL